MGMYHRDRGWENLQRGFFPSEGKYEAPILKPVYIKEAPEYMVGISQARRFTKPNEACLHFYSDDYLFNRVWTEPGQYIDMVKRFKYVLTPNFSLYTDFPLAMQIYNHYRSNWCGAYWQSLGAKVIPTVCWSDERSYDWCFDGIPKHGTVSVSSVGTQTDDETKELFMLGFLAMAIEVRPRNILFYGQVPAECYDLGIEIMHVEPFYKRLHKLDGREE